MRKDGRFKYVAKSDFKSIEYCTSQTAVSGMNGIKGIKVSKFFFFFKYVQYGNSYLWPLTTNQS